MSTAPLNYVRPQQGPNELDYLGTQAPDGSTPQPLQPIRPVPQPSYQPNPLRQREIQSLQNSLYSQENKPKPTGFWPKAENVLRNVGSIAGGLILGNDKLAGIPGTTQHEAAQHNATLGELGTLEKQEEGSQNDFATNQLKGAQAGKAAEETQEMPGAEQAKEKLEGAEAEKAGRPDLAQAYATAVTAALNKGGDPSTDPVVQHLADAITAIQKQPADATPIVKPIERGGKPHEVMYDKKGNEIKDLGESGEKPPALSLNLGREEKNDLIKAYQPTLDSAERMNVMTESYEKAIKDHDQQAMLNLLANHLGMTMGLQKGARLTKDIINEAKQSQPWLQGIESKFDKDGYLAGVTLSPNQMRQMVALGQERYAEDAKKSRSTAQYLGAKDDGPERTPGKATINYYLAKTGGDATKAKQLALEDGWTVK
jgi:hypothetical protein